VDDVVDAIGNALSFIEKMEYEDFFLDNKTIFAVTRALEIIGEAVKNIPQSIKSFYPQIPWKEIAGMRNKLIYEYFGVKQKVVWETVKKDLPLLKTHFDKIREDCAGEIKPF
jgi:uncharacterized protein with HEPN domain